MTLSLPTSQNKETFKNYLRTYKDRFSSPILSSRFEEVSPIMLSYASGITSATKVDVALFNNAETIIVGVGTTNVSGEDLIYLPGLENDFVNLQVGNTSVTINFTSSGISIGNTSYSVGGGFSLEDKFFTVKGVGGVLLQSGNIPTYSVTASTSSVNEGNSVSFTVNTTDVVNGTTLYYSTGGSMEAADFSNNSLTGSFNIVGTGATTGIATVTRTIANDALTEGNESFTFVVRTDSTTGPVVATSPTITVVDVVPIYSVTPSTTSVNEGSSVTFTVTTTDVANGTVLYWQISGTVSASDFSDAALSGSFTINNNTGTVTKTIATDILTEGNETFTFVVKTGSTTGPVVATSSLITVVDVLSSYSIVPSTTSVNEGSTVTFTVTTVGVPNGSVLYWTASQVSGTLSASDFSDAALSGSFIVNNNTGTIVRTISADRSTESTDIFEIQVRRSSITGDVVATSNSVIINDTSKNVGSSSNGLTFGPVQVNRDNGNAALASDWYTICGLENIPDGSSIALFIDGSGSMTQATVQASYELLVSKLNARGITITTVKNSNEDWITPFLVDLP